MSKLLAALLPRVPALLPALLPAFLLVGCADRGLGTGRGEAGVLTRGATGAPSGLEPASESTLFPTGQPSALRGRLVYTANCSSCHGTWVTAAERQELDKEAALPATHPDFARKQKEMAQEGRWPIQAPRVGPDFSRRDWRFQRTPGQLYQLVALGRSPAMEGDPSRGERTHPGPSGRSGEGWIRSMKDLRGGMMVVTGDSVPVWNAVFYVWSRSIAAESPARFKEVWDLYGQNCSVCHGDTAQGNGPLAHTLNPPPFNFSNLKAMAETPDAYLYWRISEGGQFKSIPKSVTDAMSKSALQLYLNQWSAMPSWRGPLNEAERWALVDGVRSRTYEHE
jgi:mono/diheme cytochrome c family protein